MLSVEVIAKMEGLSVALARAQQQILSFVSTSDQAIRTLQGTLNSLGFQKAAVGARQFTGAVKDLGSVSSSTASSLQKVKTATAGVGAAQTATTKTSNESRSTYGSLGYQIQKLALTYFSLQAAINAVKYAFAQNIKVDSITVSLKYLLGSAEEAAVRFDRLKDNANKLGLEYTSLGAAYQLFIGSAKASHYDLDVSEKLFYSLSKAGAVLHLSQEKVAGSLYAVQQMMDKGTVQSEELKRQLGNALPGAVAAMAKAMQMAHPELKVTNASLFEMMKKGKVLSSEVLPYLGDAILQNLGIDKVEVVDSLQASFGRFKNAMTDAVTEGGGLASFFKGILELATYVVVSIDKMANSIHNVYNAARKYKLLNLEQNNNLSDSERSELAQIRHQEAIAKGKQKINDLEAVGAANGERIANSTNSHAEAKKKLAEQEDKLYKLYKTYNYALAFAKDIKNTGAPLDAAIAKTKQLQREIHTQQTTVDTLGAAIDKTYGKGLTPTTDLSGGKNTKSHKNDALEKARKQHLKDLAEWAKKEAETRKATGEFIVNAINAEAEFEVNAEKKRLSDLAIALAEGDKITEALFNVVDKPRKDQADALAQKVEDYQAFVEDMAKLTTQFLGDTVGMFAEGIGQMIAGDLSFKDFGKGLLSAMGKFLADFGKQLIAFATASMLFVKLKQLVKTGGAQAIPAAIALIAAGIALTIIGSAISSSMGGNSGGKRQGTPGFANGVTNFGGGLALVGERGPELVSLPSGSGVTPAGPTQRMLNGQQQIFIPEVVLRGEDLYVSFKRTERKLDRVS